MSESGSVFGGDRRWAHFRFMVVGPLLAAPPERGELQEELDRLATKKWCHPITGEWLHFGASTIERWYYQVRKERRDPVGALGRKIREDRGKFPSLSDELRQAIDAQYRAHLNWSYQLHADNLRVMVKQDPGLGSMPSCSTLRRYMKATGLLKRRRWGGRRRTKGAEAAERRFESLEVRSYESEYVNAMWHLDFHHSSLPVLTAPGEWVYPLLLGILDDHSRLCCHLQWYLGETAENLVHGLSQALEKRGMPRALMTDNGSAMKAAETVQGLARLSMVHERTLPYSPYQNGKQESFWGPVEGRLLQMLEGCADLTLGQLNEATQAWVELEYNRQVHSETGQTPLARFVGVKDVGRPAPTAEALREAFTAKAARKQRRSDGTFSLEGRRFELPSHYRNLTQVSIRHASWDLSHVYLVDARTEVVLTRLYPLDKRKNADGRRRRKAPLAEKVEPAKPVGGIAPLLAKLIADYAATGLPPAYLPKDEVNPKKKEKEDE